MLAMLKIELEMGADGIPEANDRAYKNAPMKSPVCFNEYIALYLKVLVSHARRDIP